MPETPIPPTPELDRQKAVRDSGKAETVQEFIDWMGANGYVIMERCLDPDGNHAGFVGPIYDFERLMQKHFDIDGNKIEAERRALLEHLRLVNS